MMKTLGKVFVAMAAVAVIGSGCARYHKPTSTGETPTVIPDRDRIVPTETGYLRQGESFKPDEKWIGAANWSALPKIHFDYDRAVIRESERAKMQQIADYLLAHPSEVMLVAGHCDERGTAEYNRALGERRANAAREFLARLGISADRIATISYGKDKPLELGHTEAARAQNRRDEFGVGTLQPTAIGSAR